jgi:hypothetical protein
VDIIKNAEAIRNLLREEKRKKDINDDCSCCNDLQYMEKYLSLLLDTPKKYERNAFLRK